MTTPAPRNLPWLAVAIILGTLLGAAALAALVTPQGALPAMIGALGGLVGAFLAPTSKSLPAILAGLAGLALTLALPGPLILWLICLAFCAGAGLEASWTGGRAMVMALYSWLAVMLIPAMPEPATAVPFAAAGLISGWAISQITGLAGKACPPKGPPAFGMAIALYLALGLAISIFVIRHVQAPFAHWIALIFTLRALAQPGLSLQSSLRFGLGALSGSIAALLLIALHLPHAITLALALALLAIGLRLAPHPRPYAPAAFSAAVLLIVAPDIQPALFRIETTGLVVTLSVVLSTALGLIIDRTSHSRLL